MHVCEATGCVTQSEHVGQSARGVTTQAQDIRIEDDRALTSATQALVSRDSFTRWLIVRVSAQSNNHKCLHIAAPVGGRHAQGALLRLNINHPAHNGAESIDP